ncbi:uncharacterized protein STEHIDRAFT_123901 [Stereum hirsutum FP-91666 SS1]|uniref:uncharacterized protein n=1 Tax=Stereum hirsutum (strain FP-91666) TaxID=721885 RepID=UPI000444A035|nr:uncharacterized protein STEHIDRAFT_123901 [Stereum hirsutum FP-91666 SS1]EIM83485.1 hypothetical protein STEHIDRAFT_123901 [Stereum hirsutum FP-91666 SS1]
MSTEQHNFQAFDLYADQQKYSNNPNNFDFSFFQNSAGEDNLIVPASTFESDLDLNLADIDETDLQLLSVAPAFTTLRNEPGPLSTITVSSESAYDGFSTASESFYNFPLSPANYAGSSYSSYPLEMDFSGVRIGSDYGAMDRAVPQQRRYQPAGDMTSFGALPPSPPISPPVRYAPKAHSDYNPGSMHHSHTQAHPHTQHSRHPSLRYPVSGSTAGYISSSHSASPHSVSPTNVSPQLPTVPPIPPVLSVQDATELELGQSRRKHQCPQCNRAFARAYNLKTHMDTHNPDRPKPHICPFRSCGRSFSRKHDLQRHRAAIHRDQGGSVSSITADDQKLAIGVDRTARAWCDGCGKSWFGKEKACNCAK